MTTSTQLSRTSDRDALRAEVSQRLQQAPPDDADRAATVDALITDVLRQHNLNALSTSGTPLSADAEQELRQTLLDSFIGLGELQQYIDDDEVENIAVNGADQVWVTYAGKRPVQVDPIASSDDELIDMLQTVARHSGAQERRFDLGMPRLDLLLPGGSRLFATMTVTPRVSVSIRRHRFPVLTLHQMADLGSITPEMIGLFGALVRARCNIVISGGMNTGKTTMARALCRSIEPWERIITIEDPYELGLDQDPQHPNTVPMQPREPNIEGKGGIDMTTLVRWATRMNPDHVVVGEVRGAEVIPLLNAFNQGTDGSMTTIHASSTRDAWMKIASYARQATEQLPFDVTFQLIGGGVDIIVQLGKGTDGRRFITGVREVIDSDGTQVRSNEIYRPGPHRRAVLTGRFSDDMVDRLSEVGFDPQGTRIQERIVTGLAGIAGMLLAFGTWLAATGSRRTDRPGGGSESAGALGRWRQRLNRRTAIAVLVGVLVGILTRWPVAAVLAALFTYAAPTLLGMGQAEARTQATLEALASWVETIRGEIRSYAGIEQAIRGTAAMAKDPIATEVHNLAAALDRGVRLRVAMDAFRADLSHPVADLIGISLVKAATSRIGSLADQLGGLAESVREDVAARERIYTTQSEARTSARLVVLIVAAVGIGLYLFNRSMLPLGTLQGQAVLAIVSACWAGAGLWLHRLATTPNAPRVFRTHDEVSP